MWTYNSREDIEFKKGQLFTNVDAFRAALKDYVIQKGFPIKRPKNEKTRCTAICDVDRCTWRIHASPVADSVTFMIKSYTPEHTCVMDNKNREAISDWMAKKLIAVIRTHPHLPRKGIEAEMLKYGVHPSKQQVYRAKQKAREEIEGTHSESFSKLQKYAVFLRQHNPGSLCSFGGVLLTAVALDANNSIFPIVFTNAEVENKETWRWFFYFFEEFFGPFHNNSHLTVMSDRQKGLNLTYEELLPSAIGRYCCRHICSNFKYQFPRILLTSFFWQAAKSYDAIGFREAMQRIKDMNIEAWRYLSKIPVGMHSQQN
ncbi:uncharacterized protein [Coffea arabica]|uniref:Transposase MuDR plant domain-containing protein n=1 Tax=Coffea arabica TaxID=13443 RepID=A0A6P6WZ19_COFAR